jgi:hypothetical protein
MPEIALWLNASLLRTSRLVRTASHLRDGSFRLHASVEQALCFQASMVSLVNGSSAVFPLVCRNVDSIELMPTTAWRRTFTAGSPVPVADAGYV